MLLCDTKGPPPELKGKTLFTPYHGFIPGTLAFTHYTPAKQSYSPCEEVITETRQYSMGGALRKGAQGRCIF